MIGKKNSVSRTFLVCNIILLLFIYSLIAKGQVVRPFPQGIGIEFGIGHNQFFWRVKSTNQSGDRLAFSLQPTIRILYKLHVSDKINLAPFVGYDRFGGKSDELPNGYKDEYWFDALELGINSVYNVGDFNIGAGVKANRHLRIIARGFGSVLDSAGASRSWSETNVMNDLRFPKWSSDLGIRFAYVSSNITVGTEAWFGITNLLTDSAYEQIAEAHENHFRLLVSYVFH